MISKKEMDEIIKEREDVERRFVKKYLLGDE